MSPASKLSQKRRPDERCDAIERMTRLPRAISIAAQLIGVSGVLLMFYGIFRFLARPPGEGEGDDQAIGRAMNAVGTFVAGGVITFAACICVYVERLTVKQHRNGR